MIEAFVTQIYKNRLITKKSKNQSQNEKKIKDQLTVLNSSLADDVENLLMTDTKGHLWSRQNYVAGYTSYGSIDKLHCLLPNFKKLEKMIQQHVKAYIESLDYDIKIKDLVMTHCWVNVMPEGAQHTSHIHPLSVISGTYYLQVPSGCSAIKFEDPRLGFFMNTPSLKTQHHFKNKRFLSVTPHEGDLILFESWIRHEVPRNQTQEPRVSISFNYGWNNQ